MVNMLRGISVIPEDLLSNRVADPTRDCLTLGWLGSMETNHREKIENIKEPPKDIPGRLFDVYKINSINTGFRSIPDLVQFLIRTFARIRVCRCMKSLSSPITS